MEAGRGRSISAGNSHISGNDRRQRVREHRRRLRRQIGLVGVAKRSLDKARFAGACTMRQVWHSQAPHGFCLSVPVRLSDSDVSPPRRPMNASKTTSKREPARDKLVRRRCPASRKRPACRVPRQFPSIHYSHSKYTITFDFIMKFTNIKYRKYPCYFL